MEDADSDRKDGYYGSVSDKAVLKWRYFYPGTYLAHEEKGTVIN
jgi:hypothetical protein